jgi:glycosyltransferase involved in cell wall biosynthesis
MAVMMVAGTFPEFYEDLASPLRRLVQWLVERFSIVIVQTESWKRFYHEIAPRGKYLVLSNGVDCEEFVPTERGPANVPVLLFVGWLIREKGVFDLIEAARILRDRGSNFVLKLVGPFHGHEPAVRAQISAAGLGKVIEALGAISSREGIITLYQRADVFVLPSWAEGLPVAVLEAMASGLPVVASRVGGVPDLVEDGVSGFLIPPRDPSALAVALERLIVDPDSRSRMGRAARAKVESSFSNDAFIRGVLALLAAHADSK